MSASIVNLFNAGEVVVPIGGFVSLQAAAWNLEGCGIATSKYIITF
jgi:hypothetical protein